MHDIEASNMVRDKIDPEKGADALMISFNMFNRIITETSFSKLMEVSLPYGKTGMYQLCNQQSEQL